MSFLLIASYWKWILGAIVGIFYLTEKSVKNSHISHLKTENDMLRGDLQNHKMKSQHLEEELRVQSEFNERIQRQAFKSEVKERKLRELLYSTDPSKSNDDELNSLLEKGTSENDSTTVHSGAMATPTDDENGEGN